MNILDDLEKRGLLDNFSDEEKIRKMLETKQTIYCGFDPSAKSLQLGNFIMITILQRLQAAGHRVIAVLGGATGMIGDPSGKKAERQFLGTEQVKQNAEAIKKQLEKYIDTSDQEKGMIINNLDNWKDINVLTYLREFGKYFQIGYMLSKEIVKSRLEAGISYAEFSYMILQAGDFDILYNKYHCTMQFGGGDQWGNLTTALDYLRKKEGSDAEAEVFSFKLITDSNGKKFGKSENGALYLDPAMTSPYKIYQYFMNVSDSDVLKYLYIFDKRPIEQINEIYKNHMEHPELRNGQKELARVIVSSLHGEDAASHCEKMSSALFKEDFTGLKASDLEQLTEGLVVICPSDDLPILDALVQLKLASSKREARDFVTNGAIKLNGTKCTDINTVITQKMALEGYLFVKRGKKLYAVLKY